MKVISRITLLVVALFSFTTEAASLGSLTPKSKFGQPLVAEVEVLLDGLPAEDYQAGLASPAVHDSTEVDYTGFHQGVTSQLVPVGDGKFAVRLSTTEKLKEPVFDFVLELSWRGGRVQRLYTLLPEFISTTAGASAPISQPYQSTGEPTITNTPINDVPDTNSAVAQPSSRSPANSLAPVDAGNYLVQTGDSLWLIASRMSTAHGTLAHRIDMLMMANLSLIKSNVPIGIHPGDSLTIPRVGETIVSGDLLDLPLPKVKSSPAKQVPFYRQTAAKEALLARVRGRQLIRLAVQAGRFIEPARSTVDSTSNAAEFVQQRVDELDRRDTDIENRLSALNEKIDRVLSDEAVQQPALVTSKSQIEESHRIWVWWLIPVIVILLALVGVSLWVYLQRRKEMEQELQADDDNWQQDVVSDYRAVDRDESTSLGSDEIELVDEGFDSASEEAGSPSIVDEIIDVNEIKSQELADKARVKVRDPDLDNMDTTDAVPASVEDTVAATTTDVSVDNGSSKIPASIKEDDGADIEFSFTEATQSLDTDSFGDLSSAMPIQDDDALTFELPDSDTFDKSHYSIENSESLEDSDEVDAWQKWDEVTDVELVGNARDDFDLDFDLDSAPLSSEVSLAQDVDSQELSKDIEDTTDDDITYAASKPAINYDETVQLSAPLIPSSEQGQDDVGEAQELVEPLKRMLLAGPQRQPKVKAVAASATSSPFESMLLDTKGDTSKALFYIEINDLDDIENRIGPLDAEQVAQHLGVKIRDYVGLQGLNDELMRLRDSTYLYVGDYQQESELIEYGEAIAQMVSGAEFLSNGVDVGLTVSIGIVPIGPHFESVNEYLICAKKTVDEARLLAQDGLEVPQVALFSAPVDMLEQDEALVAKVTEYIRDEQFDIVFQPLINLTGECEYLFSAKAEIGRDVDLARLPEHFLASAYSSVASVALDKYAIRQSLEQVIHLHSQRQEAVVMVRVSNNSIHDPAFITWLKKLVVGHEHYAKQVVLCLDEHLIAGQRVACWSFCNSLKNSGYRIGVNNFGATKDSLDHAIELGARIVRFDNDKVNLAIKTSEGIEHLSRLAVACKERGIETITYTFNSTAIPSIWQFNIDAIRSNYILVPDRSNNFEISGT